MQLQFEVLLDGEWTPVKAGILLADGRYGFTTNDGRSGVKPAPLFRQTEASTRQPEFRQVCWEALTPEEKEYAVTRMGGQPTF